MITIRMNIHWVDVMNMSIGLDEMSTGTVRMIAVGMSIMGG
jgi:hypothetical protein